jgi:uncharacterized cofD-like protein
MENKISYRLRSLMLPGLKRWILIGLFGIAFIVVGVLLVLGYHPITLTGNFIRECLEDAADVLPHRISGIMVITSGALIIFLAVSRISLSILGAYLPADRESIPDVLFRRRHLERGPKVVVIGGGTGLSNLLQGLKRYTNKITAIVTVGDDGGSSGRLRQELGVLPPGDIRNCITALADEDKLVTELFRYRFEQGQGLEGHSFGNLFLTAICAITNGDMIEAVRVASRVLNSCGQVLPSTLANISLVASMHDGREVRGESSITKAGGHIQRIRLEPVARATPAALEAILDADLIILGPGSLYTSIIPNLLVRGVPEAIKQCRARKVYVCNVMTQPGETADYTVSDHIQALLEHSDTAIHDASKFVQTVLVNEHVPVAKTADGQVPVRYDPERVKEFGIHAIKKSLVSEKFASHHDSIKLAEVIMYWFAGKGKATGLSQRVASTF